MVSKENIKLRAFTDDGSNLRERQVLLTWHLIMRSLGILKWRSKDAVEWDAEPLIQIYEALRT
jgi:hypothetical protein